MDSFEQLVSELLWSEGYWVQTSVKVELTREEKISIGRPSSPRWEIDVVAYKGSSNELLAMECKSFLDSRGVSPKDVKGQTGSARYKLFTDVNLRDVVLGRLCRQMVSNGSVHHGVSARMGLAAGKVVASEEDDLEQFFQDRGWLYWSPAVIVAKLRQLSNGSYENQISSVVAKLFMRNLQLLQ